VNEDDLTFDDLDDLDLDALDAPPTDLESKGKPQWATCGRCHARWRNRESYAHCPTCHLTFTSNSGFDQHKSGPYDVSPRPCSTPDDLAIAGWGVKPGHLYDKEPTADLWSLPAPATPIRWVDLYGADPDFTGDVSTAEWLRVSRGED